MKKLISMALATIMAMSLACTAFATSSLTRTSNLSGLYAQPTINVTIPTAGKVVLNPYKLTYTLKAADSDAGTAAVTSNDLIAFEEGQIINASNVGVDISVVVTGKPTNITLEKASVKKDDGSDAKTTKSAYMYVQFANATATTTGTGDDAVTTVAGSYAETPVFTATDTAAVDSVLIQSTASKATTVLTLEAGTEVPATDSTEASVTPTYGVFKVAGDIVSKPATAYDAKDKVDVTIAWTIIPLMVEADDSTGD